MFIVCVITCVCALIVATCMIVLCYRDVRRDNDMRDATRDMIARTNKMIDRYHMID